MEKRIIVEKINHKGQELECYVPQIIIFFTWKNILSEGSYILKDSFDPVILCKKCHGEGCSECQKRGFRKGISEDNKHIAESFLDKKFKELQEAIKITKEFS